MRVVFCGTAAAAQSARAGAYYAGPGNRFWATLHEVGLTPKRLQPTDYAELPRHGIGLTDLCKVRAGSDRAVGTGGFDVERLKVLLDDAEPAVLAFNGKRAGQAALRESVDYGRQERAFGKTRIHVLPSTSAAANGYWDIGPCRDLAAAVGLS